MSLLFTHMVREDINSMLAKTRSSEPLHAEFFLLLEAGGFCSTGGGVLFFFTGAPWSLSAKNQNYSFQRPTP